MLAALNADLAAAFGDRRIRASTILQESPRALVALAQDGAEPVVVKQFRGDAGPVMVERLRAEHDRIGPHMAGAPFRLATYRDLAPDRGLAVLAHAPGQRVDHALHQVPARRAAVLALAGGWLAAYCAPGWQDGSANLHARIRKRKETAGSLPPEDAALTGRAFAVMRALARGLAGQPLGLAISHADFAPHNLHLTDGPAPVLWGFDVQQTRVLPVAVDAARFLTLIALRLGPGDGPRRHGLPQADLSAFLGGMGRDALPGLPFFVADHLIRGLIEKRHDPAFLAAARAILIRWLEEQE